MTKNTYCNGLQKYITPKLCCRLAFTYRKSMASSSFVVQGVITCSLCENPTTQYCNDCQVNLCVDCVSAHIEALQSMPHYVVSFKNRKIRLVYPSCLIHLGHRCEAMCQQCQTQVCIKCCFGPHKITMLKPLLKLLKK